MFEIGSTEIKDDFSPIPTGLYPAYVDNVEFKQSKAGAEYMNVKFKIFGENYANRVVWNIYNVMHAKEQVRNIAFADLKKMFTAAGMTDDQMNFTSKEDLADAVSTVRCMLKIAIKKDEYGEKNIIKGYEVLEEKLSTGTGFSADDLPF